MDLLIPNNRICKSAESSISDFETNTEKSGYLYLVDRTIVFVGNSPQGGGMASRVKSPLSGLIRFQDKSLKKTKGCYPGNF